MHPGYLVDMQEIMTAMVLRMFDCKHVCMDWVIWACTQNAWVESSIDCLMPSWFDDTEHQTEAMCPPPDVMLQRTTVLKRRSG